VVVEVKKIRGKLRGTYTCSALEEHIVDNTDKERGLMGRRKIVGSVRFTDLVSGKTYQQIKVRFVSLEGGGPFMEKEGWRGLAPSRATLGREIPKLGLEGG